MKTKTNAERLEEIKYHYFGGKEVGRPDILRYSEIEWLIQQAERVQDLEESIKGFAFAVEAYSEMPVKEAMEQVLKFAREEE